jgi:hypothetical protein
VVARVVPWGSVDAAVAPGDGPGVASARPGGDVDGTRAAPLDGRETARLLAELALADCENRWRWAEGDCLDHGERPPCWRCGAREVLGR